MAIYTAMLNGITIYMFMCIYVYMYIWELKKNKKSALVGGRLTINLYSFALTTYVFNNVKTE